MINRQNPTDQTQLMMLRLLAQRPEVSQRAIAKELGISLGGVNYCIKALVKKGLVKLDNFGANKNKVCYFYLLTPAGITLKAQLTAKFLSAKLEEYETLKRDIDALRSETLDFESSVMSPSI